jgi:hypothetical protein
LEDLKGVYEMAITESTKRAVEEFLGTEMKVDQELGAVQNKEVAAAMLTAMNTSTTLRRDIINRLLNPTRDIDQACGYPTEISTEDYREMYNRMGIAKRVVHLWPEECWMREPSIYEKEETETTEFEKAWAELTDSIPVMSLLCRGDILSGIGQFGVLLLGLDDGQELDKAVDGINEQTGEGGGNGKGKTRELLYLRAFDQSVLKIEKKEKEVSSPRFGLPTVYKVTFQDKANETAQSTDKMVHWTRVIHLADNRETSEVYGVPRMKPVYNNLMDVKKVGGGSAEMFWKGGFPGYSFELSPEAARAGAVMETETVKEQMLLYMEGLQRYLALQGVNVKTLEPQVADPTGHLELQIKMMAISLGIPYRKLLGTEESKLASVQDTRTWNARVAKRQYSYVTPMVVRPFVERLIALSVLPEPKEFTVDWPDLDVSTDQEVAETAEKQTSALAKYVGGSVDQIIPPKEYLTMVHKMSEEEATAIEAALATYIKTIEPEEEPEPKTEPQSRV